MDENGAFAGASDASVEITEPSSTNDDRAFLEDAVRRLSEKVEKCRNHLANAEKALAEAEAELAEAQ